MAAEPLAQNILVHIEEGVDAIIGGHLDDLLDLRNVGCIVAAREALVLVGCASVRRTQENV